MHEFKVPRRPLWEDPSTVAVNLRSPHVPLRSHPTLASAIQYYRQIQAPKPSSASITELSGREWNFRLCDSVQAVPLDFPSLDFDDATFDKVHDGLGFFYPSINFNMF